MTFSGQCPVCRDTIALSEASVIAAPVNGQALESDAPTIDCQCGSVLVAIDLSQVNDITAECRACGSKYVVDRSGAGEELPCRCGAEVTVPTAILIKSVVREISPAEIEASRSEIPELSIDSVTDVDDEVIEEASVDEELIDDHPVASELEQESDAAQFTDVEIEEIEEASVDEELIDDHPVASELEQESDAAQFTDVEIEEIEEASVDEELIDDHPVASELEQESEASQFADVQIEATDEDDVSSEKLLSLPMVALPVVVQIQLPSVPDESETGEEVPLTTNANMSAKERGRNVRLPIVAIPDVYVIQVPAEPLPVSSRPVSQQISEAPFQSPVPDPVASGSTLPPHHQDHGSSEDESYRPEQITAEPHVDALESASTGMPAAASSPEIAQASGEPGASIDATTIACPGCRREYEVMKSELGQTAECECGFVFAMQENISALDSALCEDLMPVVPLVVDRTSDKLHSEITHLESIEPAIVRRSVVASGVDRQQRQAIIRILVAAAAVFLLVTVTIGAVVWNRGGGVARTEIETKPRDMVAVPILVSPQQVDVQRAAVENSPSDDGSTGGQVVEVTSVRRDSDSPSVPPKQAMALDSTTVPKQTSAEKPSDSLSAFLAPLQSLAKELEPEKVLGRKPLFRFSEMQTKLDLTGVQFSVQDLFWLGNLWEGFGVRAENPELSSKCYWLAGSAFGLAQTLESITPSDRDLALQRQRELSARSLSVVRLAGRMDEEPSESANR